MAWNKYPEFAGQSTNDRGHYFGAEETEKRNAKIKEQQSEKKAEATNENSTDKEVTDFSKEVGNNNKEINPKDILKGEITKQLEEMKLKGVQLEGIVDVSKMNNYNQEQLEKLKEEITKILEVENKFADKGNAFLKEIKTLSSEALEKVKKNKKLMAYGASAGLIAGIIAFQVLGALGQDREVIQGVGLVIENSNNILKPFMDSITEFKSGTLGHGMVLDSGVYTTVLALGTVLGAYIGAFKSEAVNSISSKIKNLFARAE